MYTWDRLLDNYIEECRARGICEETVGNVMRELSRWGRWLHSRRPRPKLEEVDAELIQRYLEGRAAFRSKATLSATMSVLRGMGDYLVRRGVWMSNPLRWMKGPKLRPYHRLARRIDAADMQALWHAAAAQRDPFRRQLWITLLAVLYGTGLRRGELERLVLSSWDAAAGVLLLDGRKTGQERCVPLPPLVAQCLESYLPLRHNHLERCGRTTQTALWVNRAGEALRATHISSSLRALARRAGIGRITLYQFRHSCASDLLESGVGLIDVQRLLGHQCIQTTVRYARVADPARREAIARHPINGWLLGAVA